MFVGQIRHQNMNDFNSFTHRSVVKHVIGTIFYYLGVSLQGDFIQRATFFRK